MEAMTGVTIAKARNIGAGDDRKNSGDRRDIGDGGKGKIKEPPG